MNAIGPINGIRPRGAPGTAMAYAETYVPARRVFTPDRQADQTRQARPPSLLRTTIFFLTLSVPSLALHALYYL